MLDLVLFRTNGLYMLARTVLQCLCIKYRNLSFTWRWYGGI